MSDQQADPEGCFSAAITAAERGELQSALTHLDPLALELDMDTLKHVLDVYYHCYNSSRGAVRKTEFIRHLHAKPSLSKALHTNPMMKRRTRDGQPGGDSDPWAYVMPELAAILGETITWADVLKAVWNRISKPLASSTAAPDIEYPGPQQRVESPPPALAYDVKQYESLGPTREDDSPSAVRGPSPAYSESVSAVHPFLRDTIEPAVACAFAAASSASLAIDGARQVDGGKGYVPPIDMPPRHFAVSSRTEWTAPPEIAVEEKRDVYELLLEGHKSDLPRTRSQTPRPPEKTASARIRPKTVRASHLRSHSATSTAETAVPVGPSMLQRETRKSHKKLLASLESDREPSSAEHSNSASFKARKLPRVRTVTSGGPPGTFAPIVVGSHQTHVAEQEVRHRLGNTKTRPRKPDTTLAASMSASFDRSTRGPLLERRSDPPKPFTARPVPWIVSAHMYKSMMSTKARTRDKKRADREAHFHRTSSLPPRLQARQDASRREDVTDGREVLLSSRTACSGGSQTLRVLTKALKTSRSGSERRPPSPITEYSASYPRLSCTVPNFKALHKKDQEELSRRKQALARKATKPVPFSFTVARDEAKTHSEKEKVPKGPARKKVAGPPSFVERDRKREIERQEKLKAEKEAREAAEKGQTVRPKSPLHTRVHHAVGPPAKPVGSEELNRRKKQQARAAAEWRREVKRMLERVSRQPLLMDRVTLDASKERAKERALVKIKKELIAKKVTNWQSYFQTEELNILEMAELRDLLGRSKGRECEEEDYDADNFEEEETHGQSVASHEGPGDRPVVEEGIPAVGSAADTNSDDISSVHKAPSTRRSESGMKLDGFDGARGGPRIGGDGQNVGGPAAAPEGDASDGSDIWAF
ncbi:hypothetical protein FOZ62_004413 [Perkinsus olseni]|uniref:Uncharacterized protein n=1 Tax=Perkinsus olseni TaxID=32597 RepID=A0A7J6RFP7_PEROL|nr:hypothetical protein FOZ62_004413 [Perkinsus olseni]